LNPRLHHAKVALQFQIAFLFAQPPLAALFLYTPSFADNHTARRGIPAESRQRAPAAEARYMKETFEVGPGWASVCLDF
jgi:hypothetical protein